jgi:YVTN family beta-propeller protein
VSNSTVETIRVGDEPMAIAYGAGSVWVANGADGTLSRIDVQTNRVVDTVAVGNRPSGIAVGAGGIWVTVQAPLE